MKKLINIPDEIVEPLLLLAAKEHKGNLHACIIDSLEKTAFQKVHSDYVTYSGSDLPITVELHDSSFFSSK